MGTLRWFGVWNFVLGLVNVAASAVIVSQKWWREGAEDVGLVYCAINIAVYVVLGCVGCCVRWSLDPLDMRSGDVVIYESDLPPGSRRLISAGAALAGANAMGLCVTCMFLDVYPTVYVILKLYADELWIFLALRALDVDDRTMFGACVAMLSVPLVAILDLVAAVAIWTERWWDASSVGWVGPCTCALGIAQFATYLGLYVAALCVSGHSLRLWMHRLAAVETLVVCMLASAYEIFPVWFIVCKLYADQLAIGAAQPWVKAD